MPRPVKCRRVAFSPEINYFKPEGIPPVALKEVLLSIEEIEAVRLRDLERLEQEQGASRMNVSRPTFHRVLASARQKIAEAIINGKAIRIKGGNFEFSQRHFRCGHGHEWDVPYQTAMAEPPQSCPRCNTADIVPLQPNNHVCRKLMGDRCPHEERME